MSPTPTKDATSTGGNTARTAVTLSDPVSNKATTTPTYKANSNSSTTSNKSRSTLDNLGNAVKNFVSDAASATGQKPSNSTTNRSTPSSSLNNNRSSSLPSNKNNSSTINRGIVATAGNMGKAAAALINYGYSKSSINPKNNSRINITSPLSATASVGNLANKISSVIRTGSNKASSVKAMNLTRISTALSNLGTPRAPKTYKQVGNSLKGVSSPSQKNKPSWPTMPDRRTPIINSPEDAKLYYQSLWPKRADGSPIINGDADAKLYNDPINGGNGKNKTGNGKISGDYYYEKYSPKTKIGTYNEKFTPLDVLITQKQSIFKNSVAGAAGFGIGKYEQGEIVAPDEKTQLYLYGISQKTGMDYPFLLGVWCSESAASTYSEDNGGTMGVTTKSIYDVIDEKTINGFPYSNNYKEDIEKIINETYYEVYGNEPNEKLTEVNSIYYDSLVSTIELTDSLYSYKTGGSSKNVTAWDGYTMYSNNFNRASQYAESIRENLGWTYDSDYYKEKMSSTKMESSGTINNQ